MKRVADMAARLPHLYREGEMVGKLLAQPAVQIELLDEYAARVQRAHWFDETFEREEAARLAALLDFVPEDWQTLALFRAWVHAHRNATLLNGTVTLSALERFLGEYTTGFEEATGVFFERQPAELVEFPIRRRYAAAPLVGGLAPLSRFTVTMKGLDETHPSFLLTGIGSEPESVPVIVNLTTGEGLLFLGTVAQGQRLWLQAQEDGTLTGALERDDVTARLHSLRDVVPGVTWDGSQVQSPAQAMRLVRGVNELWFVTVAHTDVMGLDRFLLGLADLALQQGRWEESSFDQALFYQEPAVQLRLTWFEREPASIQARLPLGLAVRHATAAGRVESDRDQLASSVDTGIGRLRAAGVRSEVVALSFSETQAASDFMTGMLPLTLREAGATGGERMPDAGGVFSVTSFGDSTYR